MFALGLLLVAAAGVAGIAIAMHNTDPATLAAFGETYDLTTLGVFLIGTVVGIALMTGFALMTAGSLGRRDRRREMKSRVRDVRSEKEQLADENARLRAQVSDMSDNATVVDTGDPYPTGAETTRRGRHTRTS